MNNLEPGIAFGAGKAGMGFDVLRYITTPQVILQFLSLVINKFNIFILNLIELIFFNFLLKLFNLTVYFCINGRGYNRENVCLYNNNTNACKMGTLVSGLGIVASVVYLGAEYIFQTTSSVKMRRYSIRASLGVAGTFSILYFLNFAYLSISWSKAEYPAFGYGKSILNLKKVYFSELNLNFIFLIFRFEQLSYSNCIFVFRYFYIRWFSLVCI